MSKKYLSLFIVAVILTLAGLVGFVAFSGGASENLQVRESINAETNEKTPKVLSETIEIESVPGEPHPVSIPALFEKDFNGSNLTLGNIQYTNDVYTRYYVTYTSGTLTISGIMNVPHGDGPYPALILNHGFIDPSVYTNGRGLKREQNFMARAGFIVLHPDYRNHADSSKDDRDALAVRFGYTEDVINAVYALKSSDLPFLDTSNIGMLGHSMGGGITLNTLVAQPDLVQAAVLYAPVSGDMRYSYDRWLARESKNVAEISQLYGSPYESPEFWKNLSAETFYDRIVEPIRIFHGTSDDSVPLDWSFKTKEKLEQAGVDVDLTVYDGEQHEFGPDWVAFMNSARDFFNENLK